MLEQYVAQKGKEPVILAYISFWAYGYFLGKKETDPYIFQCLEQCCRRKQEVDRICHLALLKYYAELDTYTEEQEKLMRFSKNVRKTACGLHFTGSSRQDSQNHTRWMTNSLSRFSTRPERG